MGMSQAQAPNRHVISLPAMWFKAVTFQTPAKTTTVLHVAPPMNSSIYDGGGR